MIDHSVDEILLLTSHPFFQSISTKSKENTNSAEVAYACRKVLARQGRRRDYLFGGSSVRLIVQSCKGQKHIEKYCNI